MAQKIELEGEKNSWETGFPRRRKNDTKIKVCRFWIIWRKKIWQKLLGVGCNTGYTNGIPRYKLPFSAKFATFAVF